MTDSLWYHYLKRKQAAPYMADSVLESPGLNTVLSADVPQLSCCRTEVYY